MSLTEIEGPMGWVGLVFFDVFALISRGGLEPPKAPAIRFDV